MPLYAKFTADEYIATMQTNADMQFLRDCGYTGTGFVALSYDGQEIPATGGVAYFTYGVPMQFPLAAPVNDVVFLELFNASGAEQIVNATGLIFDGSSNSTKDTITFAAGRGASIRLRGYGGKWYVIGAPNHAAIT